MAIGNHTLFSFRVFLIEDVIAKGKKDRPTGNTLGLLYHMGMMTNDQICTLVDQPSGLFSLRLAWPFHKLVSPMDGDYHQVGSLLGEAEFVRDLSRRDMLNTSVGRRNQCKGDKCDRACAEWDKLR